MLVVVVGGPSLSQGREDLLCSERYAKCVLPRTMMEIAELFISDTGVY